MSRVDLVRRIRRIVKRIRVLVALKGGLLAFALLVLPHLLTDCCSRYHYDLTAGLDRALKPGHRLIGALPREHAKTTLGTVALVLREACRGGKRNILLVAANRQEAEAKLRHIVHELETNPLITGYFGSGAGPAVDAKGHRVAYSDHEVVLQNGVRIATIGFGGKVRGQLVHGRRLDLIVLDDPEEDASVVSPELRQKGRHWVDHALLNALDVKHGSLIWLGTLLHHDSVLAQWMEHHNGSPGWEVTRHAAVNDSGEPLWPERWSTERLEQRRREIGDRAFSQEYLNQPVSLAGRVFREGDFRVYDPAGLGLTDGAWYLDGRELTVVAGVDPAIGETSRHDYFAACVAGIAAGEAGCSVYILDMLHTRDRFAAQLDLLQSLVSRWRPALLGIESVAYQAALAQAAMERGLPVRALTAVQAKAVRIESAAVQVARRNVHLPMAAPWVADFRLEAVNYPAGRHDDQLDALARALEVGLPLARGAGEVSGPEGTRRPQALPGFSDTGGNWLRGF